MGGEWEVTGGWEGCRGGLAQGLGAGWGGGGGLRVRRPRKEEDAMKAFGWGGGVHGEEVACADTNATPRTNLPMWPLV